MVIVVHIALSTGKALRLIEVDCILVDVVQLLTLNLAFILFFLVILVLWLFFLKCIIFDQVAIVTLYNIFLIKIILSFCLASEVGNKEDVLLD